ncbi:MAG: hypothetical protein RDU89_07060 [bacterium]|nr:hypothetical protein [bacterium]
MSEQGRYTSVDQVQDSILDPARKWLSLHRNSLDGSWHPLDSSMQAQVGWWGTRLSGADGILDPVSVLDFTHESRSVHVLRVVGDSLLGEYPVDFAVRLYDVGGALLHTETVTGNSEVVWRKAIPTIDGVTRVTVTVSRISRAGSVAKILEALNPFEVIREDTLRPTAAEATGYIGIGLTSADTVLVKLAEARSLTASIARVDTLQLAQSLESAKSVTVQAAGADVLLTVMSESRQLTAHLPVRTDGLVARMGDTGVLTAVVARADALAIALAEQSHPITASLIGLDALLPAFAEARAVVVLLPTRADALHPVLADQGALTALVSALDEAKASLAETAHATAQLTGIDQLLLVALEHCTRHLTAADALAPSVQEQAAATVALAVRMDVATVHGAESRSLTAAIGRNDALTASAAEAAQLTAELPTRTDNLAPRVSDAGQVTAELETRVDSLTVQTGETWGITALLGALDALAAAVAEIRQVTAYVPASDLLSVQLADGLVRIRVMATASDRHSQVDQVKDGILEPTRKWLSLQHNRLDGSFHPMDATRQEQVGWWSIVRSGPDGSLVPPVVLEFELPFAGVTYWAPWQWDFTGCEGYLPGDPGKSNGQNVLNIGGNWHFAMHYSAESAYCEVRHEGGLYGRSYIRIMDDPEHTWKACFRRTEYQLQAGKWYRASVAARCEEEVRGSSVYLAYSSLEARLRITASWGSNGLGPGKGWVRREARFRVPDDAASLWVGPYLYGHTNHNGTVTAIEYDGYILEGPFDTDPGPLPTRPVHTLQVVGDSLLGEHPVDFAVRLYDLANTLLHTETVTGNTQIHWMRALAQTVEATKVRVEIGRWSHAGRGPKIVEALNPFEIVRGDTVRPTVAEVANYIGLGLASADTLLGALAEARGVTASLVRSDALQLLLADLVAALTVETSRTDLLLLAVSESRQVTAGLAKADSLLVRGDEAAGYITTLLAALDSLAVALAEGRAVTAQILRPDAIEIRTDETARAVTANLGGADTLASLLAESAGLIAQVARSDSLVAVTVDGPSTMTVLVMPGLDSLKIYGAEGPGWVMVLAGTADALGLHLADSSIPVIAVLPVRADTMAPLLTELGQVEAQLPVRTDGLLVQVGEGKALTAMLARADALLPWLADLSQPVSALLTAADVLLPTTADGQLSMTVLLPTREDLLRVALGEQGMMSRLLGALDQLRVQMGEARAVTVELAALDALLALAIERSARRSVHEVVNLPLRQLYGKVEITYTDPFLDETIEAEATETGRYTYPDQTADNVLESPHKWLSLHRNVLDGTFHPLPADRRFSVGWWGATLANASGVLSPAPQLTIRFLPRPVFELQVVGDGQLCEYPVDFDINLLDNQDNLLHREVVTGNAEVIWHKTLAAPVTGVARMVLTVRRISRPLAVPKVVELYTSVVETYEGADLVAIRLTEEMEPDSATTLAIGNISANELVVRLNNTSRRFDAGNPYSPLRGLLRPNRRLRAWIGVEVVEGEIEWHPLGLFWTQHWRSPETEIYAEATGWDRLELLRASEFDGGVYQDHSLYELAELVLADAGLEPEEYVLDSQLESIVVPWAWFEATNHRGALQRIAAAAPGRVYCDRDGRIVVQVYEPPPDPQFTFDRSNVFRKDHPVPWWQVVNYVEVRTSPRMLSEPLQVHSSTEAFVVPAGGEVERVHAFDSQPVTEAQVPEIEAGPDVTVADWHAYADRMVVRYANAGAQDQQVTQVTISGRRLERTSGTLAVARDDESIRQLGRQALPEPVEHEWIQGTARAQAIADGLLAAYSIPRRDLSIEARGNPALRLGDRVRAAEYLDLVYADYYICRQVVEWDGGLKVWLDAQRIPDS